MREIRVPATRLLAELVDRVRPALEETGDLAEVRALVEWVTRQGTGAVRQRRAATGEPEGIVDMLIAQTAS